jgi:hypothetical protein
MSDASPKNSFKPVTGDPHTGADPLTELRNLLLEPIQVQLGKLQECLDDPDLHARDTSRVLGEAIALRSAQDRKRLTRALNPAVEDILKASLEKDRKTLINALFPVIGAAVRRTIAEAFKRMIQSLNLVLERGLSRQGSMWRIEAFRTGIPFAVLIRIEITGHTDSSGTETKNMHLSQKRAEEIRSFVAGKEISPAILNAVGVGTSEPVREETSVTDMQFNRSVTFRVASNEAGSSDAAIR